MQTMKYADYFIDQLVKNGYTHCFYVSGGNVMHLLEAARTRMQCIAVTHEVSAAIAAEYFNVANRDNGNRALAMVTAGPGFTNLVTGIAGAWLESRELLIVGGQARSNFLSRNTVRQIGHQEIDGVSIAKPITKLSLRIEEPISNTEISRIVEISRQGRKGPVFVEVCLDASLMEIEEEQLSRSLETTIAPLEESGYSYGIELEDQLLQKVQNSTRPLILVGAGLSYKEFSKQFEDLLKIGIPICTSWNAADYLDYESEIYCGRPNTYGMRWSNAAIQQCDLLISVGARLGLQQTGFNWQKFAPLAEIVHVDIDLNELNKGNPKIDLAIHANADDFFKKFVSVILERSIHKYRMQDWRDWRDFVSYLKAELPIAETANQIFNDHVNPFLFVSELSALVTYEDKVIPCSSGGAYTSVMQAFKQKRGNLLTNNKGLASMGYGLAGAIGTAIAEPDNRVILLEGDGGFAQNLQEIGTVANRGLNIKMFIFDNSGYASIRISQKAYFSGNYLGCDPETGIGLPNWKELFAAWGIDCFELSDSLASNREAINSFKGAGPCAFILKIHQDQPFLPKITSTVKDDGTIESNPIHLMNPSLSSSIAEKVFRYLPVELRD